MLSSFSYLSAHHSDQMSEGSQVSKVTLCVKILKWRSLTHSLTHSLTKVRYRAARAAKKIIVGQQYHDKMKKYAKFLLFSSFYQVIWAEILGANFECKAAADNLLCLFVQSFTQRPLCSRAAFIQNSSQ